MGSFSWTKADIDNTQVANIQEGETFKFLIPTEFGGGFIKDITGTWATSKTKKHRGICMNFSPFGTPICPT